MLFVFDRNSCIKENSVDPDQTPRSASDLGLPFLGVLESILDNDFMKVLSILDGLMWGHWLLILTPVMRLPIWVYTICPYVYKSRRVYLEGDHINARLKVRSKHAAYYGHSF